MANTHTHTKQQDVQAFLPCAHLQPFCITAQLENNTVSFPEAFMSSHIHLMISHKSWKGFYCRSSEGEFFLTGDQGGEEKKSGLFVCAVYALSLTKKEDEGNKGTILAMLDSLEGVKASDEKETDTQTVEA